MYFHTLIPCLRVAVSHLIFLIVFPILSNFIFAFSEPDLWALIRESMNVGYTILGNFQDLNHSGVNYTQKQYDALLGQCLSWSSNYTSMNVSYSVDRYVLSPDPVKYYYRDVSKYSEVILMVFYFGFV